jgi:hypothetical protein
MVSTGSAQTGRFIAVDFYRDCCWLITRYVCSNFTIKGHISQPLYWGEMLKRAKSRAKGAKKKKYVQRLPLIGPIARRGIVLYIGR